MSASKFRAGVAALAPRWAAHQRSMIDDFGGMAALSAAAAKRA
jgi:hypothetical protein